MARKLLAAFIVLALLTVGVYAMVSQDTKAEPNCEELRGGTVAYIVVDVSDRLESGDREFIESDVERVFASVPGRSHIVLLQPNSESAYEPLVIASVCTPKAAAPVMDPVLHSQNDINERDQMLDTARLAIRNAASDSVYQSEEGARRSPLMETLIHIAGRPEFRAAGERQIYLYSDMRQNSVDSSVYESKKGTAAYFRTSELRHADLMNATVHVHLVTRKKIPADDRLKPYWESWITKTRGQTDWPE